MIDKSTNERFRSLKIHDHSTTYKFRNESQTSKGNPEDRVESPNYFQVSD